MTEDSGLNVAGVYWYVCLVDGMRYIGSSMNVRDRKKAHENDLKNGKNSAYFQNAWNKYGDDNFVFELVEEVPLPAFTEKSGMSFKDYKRMVWKPILTSREQHYLNLWEKKYNICPIAYSRLGSAQPEGFGELVSARMKVHMGKPEIAEKYRQLRLGKTWEDLFGSDDATRMKLSVSEKRTGQGLGVAPANKGIPISEEHNIILQAARAAYFVEHGVWNAGTTWEEVFGPEVSSDRKVEYARLADKWFSIDENRERHRIAVIKGTQARVERDGGKHWKEGSVHSPESYRATAITKGSALHPFEGEHRTVSEIARMVGLERKTLGDRLERGEPIEQAIRPEKSKGGAKLGHETPAETRTNIGHGLKASVKATAYHESRKGKPSKPSKSGHFGLLGPTNGIYTVRLAVDGKATKFGNFKEADLDKALARRDEVLAALKAGTPISPSTSPRSGETNIMPRGDKFVVRKNNKTYGTFATLDEACAHRDEIFKKEN